MGNGMPKHLRVVRMIGRWLITLYPAEFRRRFGEQIEQNINDLCKDSGGSIGSDLLRIWADVGAGIIHEYFSAVGAGIKVSKEILKPKVAAFAGVLMVLPGAVVFAMLILQIEPPPGRFEALLRTAEGPNVVGSLIVLFLVVVLPAAGVYIGSNRAGSGVLSFAWSNVLTAVVLATLLVSPFAALSATIGQLSYSGFPAALFAILWLAALAAVWTAAPTVRDLLAGRNPFSNPPAAALRLCAFLLVTIFWFNIVADQMPCFLGIPNCD